MATILDSLGFGFVTKFIHGTATALVDGDVTGKLATGVNGLVNTGFGVIGDVLGVVRDVTAPAPPPGS